MWKFVRDCILYKIIFIFFFKQKTAYEIVINSNPCIAYLMEENTLPMQALVIAHASYGHNSFFKGNYLFRTWTDASAIIDYLVFARNYVARSEEHTSELQSRPHLVCRLLLEKKNTISYKV